MLVQVNKLEEIQKVHDWRIIGGNYIPVQRMLTTETKFSYLRFLLNNKV